MPISNFVDNSVLITPKLMAVQKLNSLMPSEVNAIDEKIMNATSRL